MCIHCVRRCCTRMACAIGNRRIEQGTGEIAPYRKAAQCAGTLRFFGGRAVP